MAKTSFSAAELLGGFGALAKGPKDFDSALGLNRLDVSCGDQRVPLTRQSSP
jgi:hypothetical protein